MDSQALENEISKSDYAVWRQDDNVVRFCIRTGLTYQEAKELKRQLEAVAHKQTYWIARTGDLHWTQHNTRAW